MKIKPTLTVNLHSEDGRGMFQLDLGAFSTPELQFMTRIFNGAEDAPVLFDVEPTGDGRHRMTFTVGKEQKAA